MIAPRISKRKLRAIIDALNAGLAGLEGEGDLAETPFADMESALEWACHRLAKTEQPRSDREG